MKKTIKALKYYTGHKSDKSFAEFVGVTENTITRAKAGHKTKIETTLKMLEWFFENARKWQHDAFLQSFKQSIKPYS